MQKLDIYKQLIEDKWVSRAAMAQSFDCSNEIASWNMVC